MEEINLRQIIEVLIRGRKTILSVTLAAALASWLFIYLILPEKNESQFAIFFDQKYMEDQGYTIESYEQLVTDYHTLDEVYSRLGLAAIDKTYTTRDFSKSINTKVNKEGNLIQVTVTMPADAELVRETADTLGQYTLNGLLQRMIDDKEREIIKAGQVLVGLEQEMSGTPELLGTTEINNQGTVIQVPEVNPLYESLSVNWNETLKNLSELKAEKQYLESGLKAGDKGQYIKMQKATPGIPAGPGKMLRLVLAAILGAVAGAMMTLFMDYWRRTSSIE